MNKLRNLKADNNAIVLMLGAIVLVIVIGGFILLAFMMTQIMNIGMGILLIGIAVLAIAAGAILLRKAFSGLGNVLQRR